MDFFDFGSQEVYDRLDELGDSWRKLDGLVDFERFRPILEECWRPANADRAKGGRPPWDATLMFKVLLIGRKTGWSDEKLERELINSFDLRRFTGLGMAEAPDAKTIWRYRNALDDFAVRDLFEELNDQLAEKGFCAKDGQMLDSTFVLTPIQRNTRDENATIKAGDTPKKWREDKATAKLRQKDLDARWTKKGDKCFYGYKNHVNVDVRHKLIQGYVVTPANAGDITVMDALVDVRQKRERLWADADCRSEEEQKAPRAEKIKSRVAFKRSKGEELTPYQKRENKARAKVRARVEHVFGSMQTELGGKRIRGVGLERANVQVALHNMLYNMFRGTFLVTVNPA